MTTRLYNISPAEETFIAEVGPHGAQARPMPARTFTARARARRRAAGTLPTGICGRCKHPLTDPESIARGYGPECAALVAAEAAELALYPIDLPVRVRSGIYEGKVGRVLATRLHVAKPILVTFGRFSARFTAAELERPYGGEA